MLVIHIYKGKVVQVLRTYDEEDQTGYWELYPPEELVVGTDYQVEYLDELAGE